MKKKPNQKLKLSQPPKSNLWGNGTQPLMIAHRGGDGAGKHKGNTLEAFQAAAELGYDYAETDVIAANSGEVVVIHGSLNWLQAGFKRDITRQTLQKMTLDQIRYCLMPGGTEIPTLEKVLSTFPKMKFIVDLKTDEVVEPLAKLTKRLKAYDRICVVGFDYGRNLRFRQACSPNKVSIGLTIGRGVRLININMLMLQTGRLGDVEAVLMHHSLVSRPMVSLVHKRGLKAIVWTANSSLSIKHAIRSGADGIISDRISLLKEILDK